MIEVRFAEAGEAGAAAEVAREVARWLAGRGEPLWDEAAFPSAWAEACIAAGELVVAVEAGRMLGVMLFQTDDPVFWPDRPAGEAAYLHRVAVRREAAGRGVADALVDWAAAEAGRRGLARLRLDCVRRPALARLYERLSFVRVDEGVYAGFEVWRYERRL